jgi:hypothetical protein
MKTTPITRLIGLSLIAIIVAGACSAGASPTPPASPTLPPDAPVTSPPDGGGVDPGLPQPAFVVPQPGQLNTHPVAITSLIPTVDGRHVTVQADWVSGVEPCYVLDRVEVDTKTTMSEPPTVSITIALFEGSSDLNVACIEIAAYKATLVDLGELQPGSYVVQSADGSAPPVSFTVE